VLLGKKENRKIGMMKQNVAIFKVNAILVCTVIADI
jgi:hypothetical protein